MANLKSANYSKPKICNEREQKKLNEDGAQSSALVVFDLAVEVGALTQRA